MIRILRNYLKNIRRFRRSAQFYGIAEQYKKDADFHRSMISYHQNAEMHCHVMAKAARATAKKI